MSNPFTTEAWAEYAVGMIVILLRTTARCWQVGLRWDGDDYFAVLCTFFFTAQLVMLELIGQNGSITGMSNQIASELTSDQSQRIVLGSKYLLAGWILYTTLLWCCTYDRAIDILITQYPRPSLHTNKILLQ
jgi:hypothetical protein